MDIEMTGLNVHRDRIMEIACLITDNDLNILAEQPSIVIHQPDSLLDTMVEWCTTTHTKVYEIDSFQLNSPIEFDAEMFSIFFLNPRRPVCWPNAKNRK